MKVRFRLRRSSARVLAALLVLSGVVGVQGLLTSPVSAATPSSFTVTSTADGAGSCSTSTTPAQCTTLRAAITAANGIAGGGGTVSVPAGTYTLSSGALTISKSMTIVGARRQPGAAATTIDGAAKDRVFVVSATGVTIDGVVVRNGLAAKNTNGGAILVNKSSALTLTKSTVANSSASQGAGIEVDGTATIDQSTFTGNTASGKGGAVFDAGTTTLQNSTLDGNAANGGGGIASSGTTTILASTITNNTSNNSNGGGLYRVGGGFTLTGSIVAANNASSGRDCYGTPTFSGTNVLQYTPGCNPAGGTILVLDPLLDPLGDNGGPTQTRRPQTAPTKSAAIDAYAAPCTTPVDQRNNARPQPTGGKCDVGSVEIAPLGLDLSMSTSSGGVPTNTIQAGVATLPLGSIPPAALDGANASSVLGATRIANLALGRVTLGRVTLGRVTLGRVTLGRVTLGRVTLGRVTLGRVTLGRVTLGDINLAQVTLSTPGGWGALLQNTPFAGAPINTLTLADVLPYLGNVPLDQIDLGPLETLPAVAWLLSNNPLAHIPLTPQLEASAGATDQDRLGAWCNALKTATADPCGKNNINPSASPASPVTLWDVAVQGYSLDGVTLDQILVRDVIGEASAWFDAMPLSNFQIRSTSLASIPVSSLPAGYVDCTKVACSTATLGQAAQLSAIDSSKTLLNLFTDAPGISQLQQFSLADLFAGLFDSTDQPWDQLNLDNTYLQNAASPKQPVLTYTMNLTVKGDVPANVNVQFALPPGFDLPRQVDPTTGAITSTALKVDGTTLPQPAIDAHNVATLALGTLTPGAHTVTLDTYAGTTLGPATANANATATAPGASVNAQASNTVNVVEALENGNSGDPSSEIAPADTVTLDPNNPTLNLAQISTPTDRDLYRFQIPNDGQTRSASIILGNLPADYDMVLYGPQNTLLRNTPTQRILPVNDGGLNLSGGGQTLSPDTVQDVPLSPRPSDTPGVIAVSANRGTADEEIDVPSLAPGAYAIQISGYNGANSNKPYSLRMVTDTTASTQCAAPPLRNSSDTGPLTDPVTLPTGSNNPHVLFVLPQQRLFATYGHDRAQPVIDRLMGTSTIPSLASMVGGVVLPVDNAGSAVAQKYAAWDANRCSVSAANDVVREIGKSIDAVRAQYPSINTVVLIGDDSVLPMARVPDRTSFGNESTFGSEVMSGSQSNELAAALSNGYTLTDDAYGTNAGIAVNEHELFVPDVALGRLVETPEDIASAMKTYEDGNGTLDPATANSAMVTGYDFMIDGAQQVAANLRANGKTVDDSLIGNSWSAQDVRNKLFGGGVGSAPDIISLNTHFDESHMLPAQERNASNNLDLFTTADLAANQGALARRLLFSMGCHAGLSVSDVSVGSTNDWAQAITGANQKGLFAGNTGYGLGDDQTVALSERLMALYAQELDGTSSAGRALMLAKQKYLGTTQVLSPYDEKALQQVVFYGLPFYGLGGVIPANNASVRLLSSVSGAAVQQQASSSGGVTISGTDPMTHLNVAPVSFDPTFTQVGTPPAPSYFKDGDPITVQQRPIEPGRSLDVTQRTADGSGLAQRAHGVLITGLSTSDSPGFNPAIFNPNIDNSANEQNQSNTSDAVFPSSLTRVSSSIGSDGPEQLATFTEGQARDPQPDGTVTQRLFTHVDGSVEYAPTDNTDFTAPFIATNVGEIVNQTAGFTVVTDSTAQRVYVLYKTQGDNGAWRGIDLVQGATVNGQTTWWGGGPAHGDAVEFVTQAVDGAGNVGLSNNKVESFLGARVPIQGNGLHINFSSSSPNVNGWFQGPVTATITGPAGASIQYTVDGVNKGTYTGAFQIGGDGVHHVIARDVPSSDVAAADVSIDTTAPNVSAAIDPGTSAPDSTNTWYNGPVSVVVTGNDGAQGSGIGSITYSACAPPGSSCTTTIAPTTVNDSSSPPLARSPLGTASTSVTISAEGSTVVTGSARDVAGLNSVNVMQTVNIDTRAPTWSCTTQPDAAWHNADVTFSCSASDAGVGLDASSPSSFTLRATAQANTQNANASTNAQTLCDQFGHCTTAQLSGIKIDTLAPTVSITTPQNGATYTVGQKVLASYSCADPAGGSGLAATNACVGTVANGAAIDTSAGTHTFSVTAMDAAGNVAVSLPVTYSVNFGVCLQYDPTKASPMTGTVPIKLQLCDAAGHNLSSASMTLTATHYDSSTGLPSPNWQGGSNTGYNFRFSNPNYIYNLDPTNPALSVGSHTLWFRVKTPSDPTGMNGPEYAAPFSVR
jgi:hypothetical protein